MRLKPHRELCTNRALIVLWCKNNKKGGGEKDASQVGESGLEDLKRVYTCACYLNDYISDKSTVSCQDQLRSYDRKIKHQTNKARTHPPTLIWPTHFFLHITQLRISACTFLPRRRKLSLWHWYQTTPHYKPQQQCTLLVSWLVVHHWQPCFCAVLFLFGFYVLGLLILFLPLTLCSLSFWIFCPLDFWTLLYTTYFSRYVTFKYGGMDMMIIVRMPI